MVFSSGNRPGQQARAGEATGTSQAHRQAKWPWCAIGGPAIGWISLPSRCCTTWPRIRTCQLGQSGGSSARRWRFWWPTSPMCRGRKSAAGRRGRRSCAPTIQLATDGPGKGAPARDDEIALHLWLGQTCRRVLPQGAILSQVTHRPRVEKPAVRWCSRELLHEGAALV